MTENISWGKIAVLVVAIVSVGALGFVVGKQNIPIQDETVMSTSLPTKTNPTEQKMATGKEKELNVVRGYVYTNSKFGFSLQLPSGWTSVVQNDTDTLSDIYFFDSASSKDIATSENPLVALMDKGIEYIGLKVNSNEFVGKPDFTVNAMKDFIAPKSLGGPDGKGGWTEMKLTTSNWRVQQLPGGQSMYFYKVKYGPEPQMSAMWLSGAAWVANGRLFHLQNKMNDDRQSEFDAMVNSFVTTPTEVTIFPMELDTQTKLAIETVIKEKYTSMPANCLSATYIDGTDADEEISKFDNVSLYRITELHNKKCGGDTQASPRVVADVLININKGTAQIRIPSP